MESKVIVIVCTLGMSSSMLISKMQQYIYESNLPVKILAISSEEALKYVSSHQVDLVLLSPQVRFLKNEFVETLTNRPTKVETINMSDYGLLDSRNILKQAFQLLAIDSPL